MNLASSTRYDQEESVSGVEWNETYPGSSNYWKPYILEGIHMAAKIRAEPSYLVGLCQRRVSRHISPST